MSEDTSSSNEDVDMQEAIENSIEAQFIDLDRVPSPRGADSPLLDKELDFLDIDSLVSDLCGVRTPNQNQQKESKGKRPWRFNPRKRKLDKSQSPVSHERKNKKQRKCLDKPVRHPPLPTDFSSEFFFIRPLNLRFSFCLNTGLFLKLFNPSQRIDDSTPYDFLGVLSVFGFDIVATLYSHFDAFSLWTGLHRTNKRLYWLHMIHDDLFDKSLGIPYEETIHDCGHACPSTDHKMSPPSIAFTFRLLLQEISLDLQSNIDGLLMLRRELRKNLKEFPGDHPNEVSVPDISERGDSSTMRIEKPSNSFIKNRYYSMNSARAKHFGDTNITDIVVGHLQRISVDSFTWRSLAPTINTVLESLGIDSFYMDYKSSIYINPTAFGEPNDNDSPFLCLLKHVPFLLALAFAGSNPDVMTTLEPIISTITNFDERNFGKVSQIGEGNNDPSFDNVTMALIHIANYSIDDMVRNKGRLFPFLLDAPKEGFTTNPYPWFIDSPYGSILMQPDTLKRLSLELLPLIRACLKHLSVCKFSSFFATHAGLDTIFKEEDAVNQRRAFQIRPLPPQVIQEKILLIESDIKDLSRTLHVVEYTILPLTEYSQCIPVGTMLKKKSLDKGLYSGDFLVRRCRSDGSSTMWDFRGFCDGEPEMFAFRNPFQIPIIYQFAMNLFTIVHTCVQSNNIEFLKVHAMTIRYLLNIFEEMPVIFKMFVRQSILADDFSETAIKRRGFSPVQDSTPFFNDSPLIACIYSDNPNRIDSPNGMHSLLQKIETLTLSHSIVQIVGGGFASDILQAHMVESFILVPSFFSVSLLLASVGVHGDSPSPCCNAETFTYLITSGIIRLEYTISPFQSSPTSTSEILDSALETNADNMKNYMNEFLHRLLLPTNFEKFKQFTALVISSEGKLLPLMSVSGLIIYRILQKIRDISKTLTIALQKKSSNVVPLYPCTNAFLFPQTNFITSSVLRTNKSANACDGLGTFLDQYLTELSAPYHEDVGAYASIQNSTGQSSFQNYPTMSFEVVSFFMFLFGCPSNRFTENEGVNERGQLKHFGGKHKHIRDLILTIEDLLGHRFADCIHKFLPLAHHFTYNTWNYLSYVNRTENVYSARIRRIAATVMGGPESPDLAKAMNSVKATEWHDVPFLNPFTVANKILTQYEICPILNIFSFAMLLDTEDHGPHCYENSSLLCNGDWTQRETSLEASIYSMFCPQNLLNYATIHNNEPAVALLSSILGPLSFVSNCFDLKWYGDVSFKAAHHLFTDTVFDISEKRSELFTDSNSKSTKTCTNTSKLVPYDNNDSTNDDFVSVRLRRYSQNKFLHRDDTSSAFIKKVLCTATSMGEVLGVQPTSSGDLHLDVIFDPTSVPGSSQIQVLSNLAIFQNSSVVLSSLKDLVLNRKIWDFIIDALSCQLFYVDRTSQFLAEKYRRKPKKTGSLSSSSPLSTAVPNKDDINPNSNPKCEEYFQEANSLSSFGKILNGLSFITKINGPSVLEPGHLLDSKITPPRVFKLVTKDLLYWKQTAPLYYPFEFSVPLFSLVVDQLRSILPNSTVFFFSFCANMYKLQQSSSSCSSGFAALSEENLANIVTTVDRMSFYLCPYQRNLFTVWIFEQELNWYGTKRRPDDAKIQNSLDAMDISSSGIKSNLFPSSSLKILQFLAQKEDSLLTRAIKGLCLSFVPRIVRLNPFSDAYHRHGSATRNWSMHSCYPIIVDTLIDYEFFKTISETLANSLVSDSQEPDYSLLIDGFGLDQKKLFKIIRTALISAKEIKTAKERTFSAWMIYGIEKLVHILVVCLLLRPYVKRDELDTSKNKKKQNFGSSSSLPSPPLVSSSSMQTDSIRMESETTTSNHKVGDNIPGETSAAILETIIYPLKQLCRILALQDELLDIFSESFSVPPPPNPSPEETVFSSVGLGECESHILFDPVMYKNFKKHHIYQLVTPNVPKIEGRKLRDRVNNLYGSGLFQDSNWSGFIFSNTGWLNSILKSSGIEQKKNPNHPLANFSKSQRQKTPLSARYFDLNLFIPKWAVFTDSDDPEDRKQQLGMSDPVIKSYVDSFKKLETVMYENDPEISEEEKEKENEPSQFLVFFRPIVTQFPYENLESCFYKPTRLSDMPIIIESPRNVMAEEEEMRKLKSIDEKTEGAFDVSMLHFYKRFPHCVQKCRRELMDHMEGRYKEEHIIGEPTEDALSTFWLNPKKLKEILKKEEGNNIHYCNPGAMSYLVANLGVKLAPSLNNLNEIFSGITELASESNGGSIKTFIKTFFHCPENILMADYAVKHLPKKLRMGIFKIITYLIEKPWYTDEDEEEHIPLHKSSPAICLFLIKNFVVQVNKYMYKFGCTNHDSELFNIEKYFGEDIKVLWKECGELFVDDDVETTSL